MTFSEVETITTRLPSWTGGVPSPMSEANRTRRGGGINLWENQTFETSTTPSPDTRFARSGSTPPVQEGILVTCLGEFLRFAQDDRGCAQEDS